MRVSSCARSVAHFRRSNSDLEKVIRLRRAWPTGREQEEVLLLLVVVVVVVGEGEGEGVGGDRQAEGRL
jgi:hypothetical protein